MPAPLVLILAGLVGTGVLPPAAAADVPLADKRWIEARSPNFTVRSTLSDKKTRQLVQELEGFRTAVGLLTSATPRDDVIPTRVLVVRGRAPDYGLDGKTAGFFLGGLRENWAVVRESQGALRRILFHEYAHFLVRNQDQTLYPPWYNEGFAELLSTVEVDGARFKIGDVPDGREHSLRDPMWMSFDRILETRSTHDLNMVRRWQFYAQSWALVHYLTYGREGRTVGEDLGKYLKSVENGTEASSAFADAFGVETSALRRKLRRYLSREMRRYQGTFRNAPEIPEVEIRALADGETLTELGWLAFMMSSRETARTAFEAALAIEPENARALCGIGDLHKLDEEWEAAEAAYTRALQAEPDDVLSLLDFGEYYLARARQAAGAGDANATDRFASLARRQFAAAHRLGGERPETLWAYGVTFLLPGQDVAQGMDALRAANTLLPSNASTAWALARGLAAQGADSEALTLVRRVVTFSHAPSEEQLALLAELEARVEGGPEIALPSSPASR